MIYTFTFGSTRSRFGEIDVGNTSTLRIRAAQQSNLLSLLRTCRRTKDGIGSSWLRQALFYFVTPDDLIETLGSLPHAVLVEIRHVCVVANLLGTPEIGNYDDYEEEEEEEVVVVVEAVPCGNCISLLSC